MTSEPQGPQNADASAKKSPTARGIILFLLAFGMSLVVGKCFEFLTSESTYASVLQVQSKWRTSLEAMAPMSLATNYLDDFGHVMGGGDWTWSPSSYHRVTTSELEEVPETTLDIRIISPTCEGLFRSKEIDCDPARMREGALWTRSECEAYVERQAREFAESCGAWEKQHQRDLLEFAHPPELSMRDLTDLAEPQNNSRADGLWKIAPVGALYRTWTRLTFGGGWNYFWAILQLGVGVLGFMVVFSSFESTPNHPRYFPQGFWGWLFGVPIGVVAIASVLAWGFKYAMLGGLIAFGWFVDLAGACCTATGVGGFCWLCFHKFAEYSVAEAIETKLK